jgi:hypothetical protein
VSDRTQQRPATDQSEPGNASRVANHLLALVATRDPQFRPTPELHDAATALVHALAAALAAGGAR